MGRGARQAAAQQQAAHQLIQHLWEENERLKAALKKSLAVTEHSHTYATCYAAPSSLDAAPFDSELPPSPRCSAFKTQLTPQQQQQVLGDLLGRLQQVGEDEEEQHLKQLCPTSPGQVRTACQLNSAACHMQVAASEAESGRVQHVGACNNSC
jgi:hypothetical protein